MRHASCTVRPQAESRISITPQLPDMTMQAVGVFRPT